MSKTYTQKEFEAALSKGIASATGRREEQFNKMIKDLGFDSTDELKAVIGERDQYKGEIESFKNQVAIDSKKQELKGLGIDERFVDFVLEQSKDTELTEYIEANPQYLSENFSKGSSNPSYNGGGKKSLEDAASDEEYLKIKRGEL